MKIALFLGSFNPFHNGHLKCVKTALKDFKMDRVIIVPTMQNPWKEDKVLDIDKRIDIIRNILNSEYYEAERLVLPFMDYKYGLPKMLELSNIVHISEIEKELIPPYYSYATLHALKNKYCNDEIFILCGEDTIKDIPDWMNGEQIIQDYNFLVVDRPKDSISSSQIREILKSKNKVDTHYLNLKLTNYVSPNIINLIKKYYDN